MSKKLRFVGKDEKKFFATTRQRVDAYFKENNISKNANAEMVAKSIFFFGGVILLYLAIISNQFSLGITFLLAGLLGMFKAFVGFNISHDAVHGSYSSNRSLNKVLGLITFNTLGGNDHMWAITHNLVHHTYTNIPGHDEDIDVAPGLIRLSPEEELKPVMRYQHFYGFLLYGLAYISWVFRKDFVKFFQDKIGETEVKHKPIDYFNLFFFKAMYYVTFIVVPLVVMDVTWWQFIIGFLFMQIMGGVTLGLVFQLAHVVEGTAFPSPNEDGDIEEAWALHQMYTTANFAKDSWLTNFLCGGLNMQIEHHLFPNICHIHYAKISKIVEQTAKEFGMPYIENKTFGQALVSHYRTLKAFGKDALEAKKQERTLEAA